MRRMPMTASWLAGAAIVFACALFPTATPAAAQDPAAAVNTLGVRDEALSDRTTGPVVGSAAGDDQSARPTATPKRPRQLELRQRAYDDSFRLALLGGFNFYNTRFGYYSTFGVPIGRPSTFFDSRRTAAYVFTATAEITLPKALRRISFGGSTGIGGPLIYEHAPIPDDAAVAFSRSVFFSSYNSAKPTTEPADNTLIPWIVHWSPFIEHDVLVWGSDTGSTHVRVGYQYWYMKPTTVNGEFTDSGLQRLPIAYQATFRHDAHLARIAIDGIDGDSSGGTELQLAILIGSRKTVMGLFNLGIFKRLWAR